jgi:16S rRNA (cytosine967-C5)-methyltransferase
MSISPARIAAYDVLLRIERDRAFSAVLLPEYEAGLNEKDRALCHQLVLGVLRRKFYLDTAISKFSGEKKIDLEVLIALRLGAYQLLELNRIPQHSAVNESVSLAQRARKTSAKGFVNAILRRISKEGFRLELSDPADRLSIETSHPTWLIKRWGGQFGDERASSIAAASNRPPRTAIRLTSNGKQRGTNLPEYCRESEIVSGAFIADASTSGLRELSDKGEVYFQDEASQLIAREIKLPAGEKFLDVCAAPGGKTALVADINSGNGVQFFAGDLYKKRVEFLRENCRRQGSGGINVLQYDAERAMPFAAESFDAILVDAPCSGTGTISSNPEIRYFLQPENILALQKKQLAILGNSAGLLRRGGRLYYSTCSLEREENEDVIAEFLSEFEEFSALPICVDRRFRTEAGFGRTFPDRDGTDGFFFAILGRS